MEELEQFKKRIQSIITRAYEGGVILLPFLDDALSAVLLDEMKYHSMITYDADGGIKNADRKRYVIYPSDLENVDCKINIYKIKYNKRYYEINHRSVLGSLMGLGIKRECIGDIIVDNDVYFAATKEISNFLEEEFKYVGKAPIELEIVDYDVFNVIKYEEKLHFLTSLRLDCVVAACYNLSRAAAQEMIKNGLVFVNYIENQNTSHVCRFDDIISVRHKGKFKIGNIGNETKSGRLPTVLLKRI